ncbi:MAG: Uma2 family endonuclease [Gemmataceae bacterium]|nr:Uma2 family endonuclease [Gemmataceae bacterium]
MPTTAATGMTAEEFYDWANRPENDGRRLELDEGEVVEMPSPGEVHAYVCGFVVRVLTEYLIRRRSGYLLTNDCGLIVRRRPDTVRGPDIMLFLENRTLDQMSRGFCERVPPLVVEVFSPSDRPGRLNRRIDQYHRRGVALVWVVYPEERTVNVCRPDEFPKVLDETDELTGNGILPDFACPVRDLFGFPDLPPTAPTPRPSPAPKRPRKGPRK